MGRVTAIAVKAPGSSTPKTVLSNISYQPFGPVTSGTFGNGVAETRGFDLDYRMTGLTDAASVTLQKLTYAYDPDDNVKSISDGVTSGNSQTFGYDERNGEHAVKKFTTVTTGHQKRPPVSFVSIMAIQQLV
jgi:hypothetical protein